MRRHTLEMTPMEIATTDELSNAYWGLTEDIPGIHRQKVKMRENSGSLVITVPKGLLDSCIPDSITPEALIGREVVWEIDPVTDNLVLDLNGAISGNEAVWG